MMKKWISSFVILILLLNIIPGFSDAAFEKGYPTSGYKISPPSYMQTLEVDVTGKAEARPKVVWVQSDTDEWSATFQNQIITTTTVGKGWDAVPKSKQTTEKLDMTVYAPSSMLDDTGNPYMKQYIRNLGIEEMEWKREDSYEPVGTQPDYKKGEKTANITVITGSDQKYTDKIQYSTRPDRQPKFTAHYWIYMDVTFKGTIVEKKQIRVLESAALKVDETKNMIAQVRTLEYSMSDWNDKWVNVSLASETKWESSDPSVATIDAKGKVTAKKTGKTTISAEWKKGPYQLKSTAIITVGDEPNPCLVDPNAPGCGDGGNGGGGDGGSVDCSNPDPGQSMSGEDLYPNVSAVIKADSRGSESFNVLDGIPTTESLYGNVWTKDYLSKFEYQQMVGKCTFEVNVTVMPPPPDPSEPAPAPGADSEEGGEESGTAVQVIVEKDYSYWTIQDIKVYQIKESALWNYAFDSGGIRIQPSGYNAPYYSTAQTAGYEPSSVPEDITVSFDADPQAAVESAVYVNVSNDTFTFYNQTLMSGSTTSSHGSTPRPIPIAPMTGENVLYSPNNVIPMSKTNKANEPSSGTIFYEQVNGSETMNFAIYGINPVTVHTPVVIYPGVSDDKAHNQKTNPALSRSAIILERPFTVQMPNSGQHANYLGYGNRNYLKYIGSKQIRFPFDVYNEAKTKFYPKNTWIEVEKSQESFTYYLPVWVDEGFYDVEFRTIAHNAPAGATHETNANLNLSHHIAYATVPVDAIGRVYDFHVTDIADYNWESVFRTEIGKAERTGASYWVGLNGIDGESRGNTKRYTLPIRPGSHPIYKNAVIKPGYHFKFDLKTKGNMFGTQDQIRITPTFYFISAQDGKRTLVDLYYHTGRSSYVKIGSPMDEVERYVVLNERLRNVPDEELTDTALYKYDHEYTFGQIANIGRAQYVQYYKEKMTKQKTMIGRLSLLQLPANVRTLLGPKSNLPQGVDSARANASIQRWYGEYSLPAELFAVEEGTNVAEYGRTHQGLKDKSPIFLRDGYIVVNFNIETVRDGQTDKPYLQYIHAPLMNQWQQMEGFQRKITDPYGRTFALLDGDVVFYHADQSSRDDFQSMVTH